MPPASLPWQWFEFRSKPRPVPPLPDAPRSLEESAAQPYQIDVDGQPIPFKYLRIPSATGIARPALLMLHGMGLTIASFRAIAPYLLATHDLILPDYSGFSCDGSLPVHGPFKAFTAAVWRIADALHLDRIDLAGSSLGGGFVLIATLAEPSRVGRIVLANPACFPQQLPSMYRLARIPILGEIIMLTSSAEKLIGGLERIGYVDKSRFDPALRGQYIASLSRRRNRFRLMHLIRELPAGPADLAGSPHLERLSEIRQPVLISWGVQDPLLVEDAGIRLAQALPNSTFEEYADLAHMPHEEAPQRIGPRWAEFLSA